MKLSNDSTACRFINRPMDNLFSNLPRSTASEEQFLSLLQRPGLRIERIVSNGQCSPADFWYDQNENEWVVLLQGEAGLRFADETTTHHLRPGDYLTIAAQRRHRVEWTSSTQSTVWLAIFYSENDNFPR